MSAIVLTPMDETDVETPDTGKKAIFFDSATDQPTVMDDARVVESLQGPAGSAGAAGADGEGVPTGGTDGQVLTKTSGVDFATAWEDPAGASDLDAILAASAAQDIAAALSGAAAPDAGNPFATMADVGVDAGADDPVADLFGAPDVAFEFGSSSLAGLTAEGTVSAENADTTIPGHYYLKAGTNWSGRSYTPAGMPWTAITVLNGLNARGNFGAAGLFVGVASLGNLEVLGPGYGSVVGIEIQKFSSLTSYASSPSALSAGVPYLVVPIYLAICAHSSTSVDFLFSRGGRVWYPLNMARNPSFTVAKVGLVGKVDGSAGVVASFGYLRIWNSALTFPAS